VEAVTRTSRAQQMTTQGLQLVYNVLRLTYKNSIVLRSTDVDNGQCTRHCKRKDHQRVVSAGQAETGDAWHWSRSDATTMHGLYHANPIL